MRLVHAVFGVFGLFGATVFVLSTVTENDWPLTPSGRLRAAQSGKSGERVAVGQARAVPNRPLVGCAHAPGVRALVCELNDRRAASPGSHGHPPLAWRSRQAAPFDVVAAAGQVMRVEAPTLVLEPGTLADRSWAGRGNAGGIAHVFEEWWLLPGDPVVVVGRVRESTTGAPGFYDSVMLLPGDVASWSAAGPDRPSSPIPTVALALAVSSAVGLGVAWVIDRRRRLRGGVT